VSVPEAILLAIVGLAAVGALLAALGFDRDDKEDDR